MMDILEKNPKDELDEGIEKAKRWTLLWFMKNGKTFVDDMVWNSRDEAEAYGQEFLDSVLDDLLRGWNGTIEVFGADVCDFEELSHFIAMPLGDE